jgi:hypothetical protein
MHACSRYRSVTRLCFAPRLEPGYASGVPTPRRTRPTGPHIIVRRLVLDAVFVRTAVTR